DVASAVVTISLRGAGSSVYNIASGKEVDVRCILEELLALAHCVSPVVETKSARKADISRQVVDISPLRDLGWQPRYPLRSSLREVLKYYLDIAHRARESSLPRT